MSIQDIQFQPRDSEEQRLKKLRQLVEEILRMSKSRGSSGSNAPDVSEAVVWTTEDQTALFPNSLQILEGTNVTFDYSVEGQVTINATGGGGGGSVDSVLGTTNQIDVDDTDPANPVLSLAATVLSALSLANSSVQPGDLSAYVMSVTGTATEIDVDNTDPQAPILSLAAAVMASLALADTAIQPGDLSLDDLNDVNAPAPSDGDVLTFDTGTGFWIPVAPTTGGGGYPEALGYAGI